MGLADMNDFVAMNTVYARRFSQSYPARNDRHPGAPPLWVRIEIDCRRLWPLPGYVDKT